MWLCAAANVGRVVFTALKFSSASACAQLIGSTSPLSGIPCVPLPNLLWGPQFWMPRKISGQILQLVAASIPLSVVFLLVCQPGCHPATPLGQAVALSGWAKQVRFGRDLGEHQSGELMWEPKSGLKPRVSTMHAPC